MVCPTSLPSSSPASVGLVCELMDLPETDQANICTAADEVNTLNGGEDGTCKTKTRHLVLEMSNIMLGADPKSLPG
jgi:hypothetical protein